MLKALFALALTGCATQSPEADIDLESSRQYLFDSINGLKAIHGLTALNGLASAHGLSSTNGLKSRHGLQSLNGLTSVNGLTSGHGLSTVNGVPALHGLKSLKGVKTLRGVTVASNGVPVDANASLPIDCGATGIPGADCWGYPDGMLNARTGLMASDAGVMTAKYLVRCALPASAVVGVVDYTGAVIRMPGEIGLAPEWEAGDCGADCQENVSACLMALTNGAGNHVEVELSSSTNALGGGHSSAFPYQEAAFYGNVFLDPPVAHFCVGKDYAPQVGPGTTQVRTRACSGYDSVCPYVEDKACGKTWTHSITTYRKDKS